MHAPNRGRAPHVPACTTTKQAESGASVRIWLSFNYRTTHRAIRPGPTISKDPGRLKFDAFRQRTSYKLVGTPESIDGNLSTSSPWETAVALSTTRNLGCLRINFWPPPINKNTHRLHLPCGSEFGIGR